MPMKRQAQLKGEKHRGVASRAAEAMLSRKHGRRPQNVAAVCEPGDAKCRLEYMAKSLGNDQVMAILANLEVPEFEEDSGRQIAASLKPSTK